MQGQKRVTGKKKKRIQWVGERRTRAEKKKRRTLSFSLCRRRAASSLFQFRDSKTPTRSREFQKAVFRSCLDWECRIAFRVVYFYREKNNSNAASTRARRRKNALTKKKMQERKKKKRPSPCFRERKKVPLLLLLLNQLSFLFRPLFSRSK